MQFPPLRPRSRAPLAALAALPLALAACGSDAEPGSHPASGAPDAASSERPPRPTPELPTANGATSRFLEVPERSLCESSLAPSGERPGDWVSLALEHELEDGAALGADPELVLRSFSDGAGAARVALDRGPGLAAPQVQWLGDGRAWCVWESRTAAGAHVLRSQRWRLEGGQWRALQAPRDFAGLADPAEGDEAFARWRDACAASGGGRPVLPRLALDASGERIACVWQGLVGEQYDLFVSHGTWERGLGRPQPIAATPTDEFSPDLDWGPGDTLWVAFDRWEPSAPAGSFDLWLARLELGDDPDAAARARRFRRLAGGAQHAAEARLSAGPDGELWIAYESDSEFGAGGALRERRRPMWLHGDAEDRWRACTPNLPSGAPLGQFPEVLATPGGPWIAMRARRVGDVEDLPPGASRAARFSDWETLVGHWNADGDVLWTSALDSHGDNAPRYGLHARGAGVALAGSSDERESGSLTRWYERPMETGWRMGWASLSGTAHRPRSWGEPLDLEPWTAELPATTRPARRAGFLYGDLHRHTHLSRCGAARDGTFLDAVRYARGPGALDFQAVTDHYQHLRPWSFWRLVRDAQRWSAPGSLEIFPGVESMARGRGHQNLIWPDVEVPRASGGEYLAKDYAAGRLIAIPHMLNAVTNPFPADNVQAARHRLIEVYQGLRGSYEEPDAPLVAEDAKLPTGHLLDLLAQYPADRRPPGLIAASDHRSSLDAYAGLPVPPHARRVPPAAELFEALLGRDPNGPGAFGSSGCGPSGALAAPGLRLEAPADEGAAWILDVDGPPVAHVAWRAPSGDLGLQFPELSEQRGWRYHLRYRGPERWTGQAMGLGLSGGAIAEHTGNATVSASQEVPGELVLELAREALDLALVLEPDPDAGEFTLTVALGTRRVVFDLNAQSPGTVRRGAGGDATAASIQLWSLGPAGPAARGAGPQRFEWTPPPNARGQLVYARVAFVDGSVAWSPARRAR
jgi:hypothetical protein